MSRIIEKAFDASKKIVQSIFRGSPNLITTSDLNRQMEAIKHQMDQLDDKVGVLSDFSLTHSLNGGIISVTFNYSYIEYKGCSFSPEKTPLSIDLTGSSSIAYVCLVANKETITYDMDFSHEVSGAKFSDGSSYPAADQIVYKEESIMITHDVTTINNLVGILASITLASNGNVIVRNNNILKSSSVVMGSSDTIKNLDPTLNTGLKVGDTYDEAFSILNNKFNNLCPEWRKLTYQDLSSGGSSGVERDTDISFRIINGTIQLNMLATKHIQRTTRYGTTYSRLGSFPSDIRDKILLYFKSLDMVTYNKYNSDDDNPENISLPFIPFGCFGEFAIYQPYQAPSSDGGTTVSESFPAFGRGKISLLFLYYEGELSEVIVGAYIDSLYRVSADNKNMQFLEPPVNWFDLNQPPYGVIHIPRFFGVIPLTGSGK